MNFYSILFERLYAVFHKGASVNPSHEKLDGAVLTSMLLCIPVFLNVLSILHLIRISYNINLAVNVVNGVIVLFILMAFNLFFFLRKKRYLAIASYVAELPRKKKNIYSVISWIYFLGSWVLFFLLLKVG